MAPDSSSSPSNSPGAKPVLACTCEITSCRKRNGGFLSRFSVNLGLSTSGVPSADCRMACVASQNSAMDVHVDLTLRSQLTTLAALRPDAASARYLSLSLRGALARPRFCGHAKSKASAEGGTMFLSLRVVASASGTRPAHRLNPHPRPHRQYLQPATRAELGEPPSTRPRARPLSQSLLSRYLRLPPEGHVRSLLSHPSPDTPHHPPSGLYSWGGWVALTACATRRIAWSSCARRTGGICRGTTTHPSNSNGG
jgi:hypothetical protein